MDLGFYLQEEGEEEQNSAVLVGFDVKKEEVEDEEEVLHHKQHKKNDCKAFFDEFSEWEAEITLKEEGVGCSWDLLLWGMIDEKQMMMMMMMLVWKEHDDEASVVDLAIQEVVKPLPTVRIVI